MDAAFAVDNQRVLQKTVAETSDNALQAGRKWDSYWQQVGKGEEVSARNEEELQLISIKAREAEGGISKLSVLHAEAQIHTAQHARAVKALTDELARLEAQVAERDPLGNSTDPALAAKIQGKKNEISQEQGKGDADSARDAAAMAAAKAAPYKMAIQQVTTGLDGALATWERGQGKFSATFGKSLGSMVIQMQSHLIQMGVMWARHYATTLLMHTATNAAKTNSDVATHATSKVLSLKESLTEANHAGMRAATNTFASVSAIPVIGPFLAPIAAAGAYTAVLGLTSLASAERGWDQVPSDGTLANLHKNEMVLPAELAGRVRNMTGGGNTINQHFGGNTIQGGGDSFKDLLDQHEDHLASKMTQLHRDGKIGIPSHA